MAPSTPTPKNSGLPRWYWLLAPAAILMLSLYLGGRGTTTLSYSDFKQLLHAGKISELTLSETAVSGRFQPGGIDGLLPRQALAQLHPSLTMNLAMRWSPSRGPTPTGWQRSRSSRALSRLSAIPGSSRPKTATF